MSSRPRTSTGRRPATATAAPALSASASAIHQAEREKARRRDPTLARSFRGHHGAVLSCAYSPVLVRASDTQLPGYEADPAAAGVESEDRRGATVSARARAQKAASSYVQQVASGGSDHVVMVWHLRPQLRAFRFLGHSAPVNGVAFSADGSLLASGSDDQTVRVWAPTNEGQSKILRGHVARVRSVAWATDNKWLLSAADDQQCKLWDVEAGVSHSHFHGHTAAVSAAVWAPDMRLVATGSEDKTVKLFDTQTQKCLQTLYHNNDAVTCLKFHPFGSVVATGSVDTSIKLWDIRARQLLQHYSAHDLDVRCIDFHPSGNYLLSSSLDSSIRLWDLRKGHQLYTIHGHPSPVNTCQFNMDGSQFVTGGNDQRVITWNTNFIDGEKRRRGDLSGMETTLPKVGQDQAAAAASTARLSSSKRGTTLAIQSAKVASQNTGQLSRNTVEPGRRDALYEAQGLSSSTGSAAPGRLPTPDPSGPLPPTLLSSSQGRSGRGPPAYTFRTGEQAGQTYGQLLYVADEPERARNQRDGSTAQACDYQHSHIDRSTGYVHSYNDQHSEELRTRYEQHRAMGLLPEQKESMLEQQPLEQQMRGFDVPGLTQPGSTGVATTRAGNVGPSRSPPATPSLHYPPTPSFAASAAGLQPNVVHPTISRPSAAASSTTSSAQRGDDLVYSSTHDRFVPGATPPHQDQASSSAAITLKNTPGIDIFAIPPADHIQRLPEQIAHTLKYMVTQLDQINRALNVFEYRMNIHEAKVDRLAQQQSRWEPTDGM